MPSSRPVKILSVAVAVAAVGLALTPSLVPRPALFQGFLAGLTFALSYLLTAWLGRLLAASLARRRRGTSPWTPTVPPWAWLLVAGGGALYVALIGRAALSWQNEVRALVDMPPADGMDLLTFFLVALIMVTVVFGTRWGLHRVAAAGRRLAAKATARLPLIGASGVLAACVAGALALALLVNVALLGTDRVYEARNDTTPVGVSEPSSEFRSAGPDSAVDWEQLGMQGRAFVGGGPTAQEIATVTGVGAVEPIRVYVGNAQAESAQARAALAVAELKRTGGFDRGTLMIATPTGSGWLERQAIDSLEYLQHGDTAIVSTQYSFQPSWVSFLFHQDLPRDSGTALYDAVKTEWLILPEASRPKLLVYGLSLGASGMQSAFTDAGDLVDSVDGAVFSGAPNNSQPWGALQAGRDAGSPIWQPVYDGGRNVRWLSNPGDFDKVPGMWGPVRIAYLQHGTDAVTWLTPRLIWQQPDWLAGPAATGGRAPDVSDSMRWIPLVTYLQVAFDMFMGEAVPPTHGHNFGGVAVEAWNHVSPSGLDPDAVERIQKVIESYAYVDSMQS